MSEFRANTDIMRKGVTFISKAANGMSTVASHIGGLANQIGGEYQGQLQEKIRPILGGLSGQGSQIQNQSEGLSTNLSSTAGEIDAVMQSNVASVSEAFALSSASPAFGFFNNVGQKFLGEWTALIVALGFSHVPVTIHSQSTPILSTSTAPASIPVPSAAPKAECVSAPVNESADHTDCVRFVKGQPGWGGNNVPNNVTAMKGGWAGGARDNKWNYGDVPKPGALMVEAKSDDPKIGATIDGVDWGHVSYIRSVDYDKNGNPISFTVIEGNWNGRMHQQTFYWPITNSKRRPQVFIYGKK